MANYAKATVVGRLGNDPEIRKAGSAEVMSLSIAVNREWGKGDDRKKETTWIRGEVWNEHAITFADKHLKKGDEVLLEGELQEQRYTNRDGQDVSVLRLVYRFSGDLQKMWKDSDNDGGGSRNDRGRGRDDDRRSDRRDDRRRDDRGGDRDRDRSRGSRRPSNSDRRNDRDDRRGRDDDRRGRDDDRGGGGYGWDDRGRDDPFIDDPFIDDEIPL